MLKNKPYLIFLLFLPILLTSCLEERKIAGTFVRERPEINLLVFPTDLVYKYNHKGEMIPDFDQLSEMAQDSALYASSSYIQHLSDSVILENYMNHFLDELRLLGFKVYLNDAIDSFMTGKPQSYVLNIAQLQLDEYNYPLEDKEEYEDTLYYKKFDLNAVDFSSWFELSKVNPETKRTTLLYATFTSYDTFDGSFYVDPWTMDIRYRYRIDTLTTHDIYDMATYLGKKHAEYLYDFFMNQYIVYHLPKGEYPLYYYHYSRQRNAIFPTEDQGFEIQGTK